MFAPARAIVIGMTVSFVWNPARSAPQECQLHKCGSCTRQFHKASWGCVVLCCAVVFGDGGGDYSGVGSFGMDGLPYFCDGCVSFVLGSVALWTWVTAKGLALPLRGRVAARALVPLMFWCLCDQRVPLFVVRRGFERLRDRVSCNAGMRCLHVKADRNMHLGGSV